MNPTRTSIPIPTGQGSVLARRHQQPY